MSKPIHYDVELTDTFGGEANYSWVKREVIEIPDREQSRATRQRLIMRKAKAAVGLTGIRGRTWDHGDLIEFRPYRLCQVMFVTWRDESLHPVEECNA